MLLEQLQHALVELRARHAGGQELVGRAALRLVELPHRLGLDARAVGRLQKEGRDARGHQHAAPDQPGVPHAGGRHAQPSGHDGAAQAFQPLQALRAGVQNAGLHGQVTVQIAQPADALGFQVESAFSDRPISAGSYRKRSIRRPAGLCLQQARHVAHTAAHGAFGDQLVDPHVHRRPQRHAALRRPETEAVVPSRRVAQASHEVGAIGHRQQAQRQRHRRAAAGATGRFGRVVGVACGAEHLVEGVRAEAELGHVGLADDDGAGGLHARRHQPVLLGNEVGHQRRAQRGGQAFGVRQVLDGLRQAVHPAARSLARFAARQLGIAGLGLGQQFIVGPQADEGVVRGVEPVDARQVGLHHLAARDAPRMDGVGKRAGVERGDVVGGEGGHAPHSTPPHAGAANDKGTGKCLVCS